MILCAPGSFKETLSAREVAEAMASGISSAGRGPCDRCPVADGGEGSLDALAEPLRASIERTTVIGPLGEPVLARYGIAAGGEVGIVELAEASGHALVPPHPRDPTRTTSYGAGQLIAAAAAHGCTTVIVCLGGSATVDCGAGIAQALGCEFLDRFGRPIEAPLTGGRLAEVAAVRPPAPGLPRLRAACDVTNPLLGPRGAAAVYGPQKGATPAQVALLEEGLEHLARLSGADPDSPGAGAAGGAGFGLAAWCGAELTPGVDLVLDAVGFDRRCAEARLVLTGEGRLDDQSLDGKATAGVARAAARLGVPAVAVVGQVARGRRATEIDALFARVISLAERYGLERSLAAPAGLIADACAELLAT